MARFKQTLPDTAFDILWKECQERNIRTVQELVRSVIIPEWVRRHVKTIAPAESGDTANAEAAVQ